MGTKKATVSLSIEAIDMIKIHLIKKGQKSGIQNCIDFALKFTLENLR
jgi:hypothetical protein